MTTALDAVLAYHQRTKHHLHRYAAGPGGMDWKNQPNPFREFAGSPPRELPLLAEATPPRYVDLYRPRATAPQALTLNHIAALLELAFGLSASKQYGSNRWFLRCNPSSGNLHPTEAYVVIAGIPGIEDGVHHYMSRDHLLEQRCHMSMVPGERERLLPPDSFLVGLASIHWREAWKYGERAYRYCQHDAGHAIAAVRYAAATLGWQARLLTSWSDADIGAILGFDRDADFGVAEREHPDAILLITARKPGSVDGDFSADACVRAARRGHWQGHANVLSSQHGHEWPVIDEVALACAKPPTSEAVWHAPTLPEPLGADCALSAVAIIKQRRSAQAFDGVTSISANTFYRMLDMTLPRPAAPPWDAIGWEPRVHLLLFVHRVEGLTPGLYLFLRNNRIETTLHAAVSSELEWISVEDCPTHFQLFLIVTADARNAARTLSCHQNIAADGAFSLGMLAEYETNLTPAPWVYRQLFWETGILGQVLYLETEAAGVRGTGIGCYFDDGVHDLLGLKGQAFQSLYHFTVGGALTDARLQTLPAYSHLKRL
jgi:SagB-type dehydrogenase family enzyme